MLVHMVYLKYRLFSCLLLSSVLLGCTDTSNTSSNEKMTGVASVPSAVDKSNSVVAHAHADWEGRWIGQEGLFVEISMTSPGQYNMQMLDSQEQTVTVIGKDVKNGIAFDRDGQSFVLRRATGDEIGLKYLDGKTNCLMVQEFEGFCR